MVQVATPLIEIRWHGRGGQGLVTASNVLAAASLEDGKFFQSFPEFGPERSGAPILAYTRISTQSIALPSGITDPDIVIVLDPSLIGRVDLLAGLKREGLLLINTPSEPARVREALEVRTGRVATIDASRISKECLKRNFPNIPTLGALIRTEPIVTREAVAATLRRMGGRLTGQVLLQNLEALRRGYEEVRLG